MSNRPQPQQLRRDKRRARVLVFYEDTHDDGPRTWTFGVGSVDLEHVTLEEKHPECNATAAAMYGLRSLEELDLLDSPRLAEAVPA